VFWPGPDGGLEEDDADFGGSEVFGGATSEVCDGSGLGSSFFVSCFGVDFESSGGIARELMSSPGSARTAIRDPTCTAFAPSP